MSTDNVKNITIFSIDWAKEDRRSVKAYLNGKDDGRILWWMINRWIHQHLSPNASLENIMFCFHSRQHNLTLLKLEFRAYVQEVAEAIQYEGAVAGIQLAMSSVCKTPFYEKVPYSEPSWRMAPETPKYLDKNRNSGFNTKIWRKKWENLLNMLKK